jgi:hypothetical protein
MGKAIIKEKGPEVIEDLPFYAQAVYLLAAKILDDFLAVQILLKASRTKVTRAASPPLSG